jgi:serine/threonine-protein kinase ATR
MRLQLKVRKIDDSIVTKFSTKISGIENEIEVLNSLQRPKKILLYGNDGTSNAFLCKPKDDLRKDARVMEFNSMINIFLSRTDHTRKRELCKKESS